MVLIKAKHVLATVMILIVLAVAGGCAKPPASPPAGDAGGHRTVTDMNGTVVTLPQEVKRVAANGAMNQFVIMLAAGDKLVATTNGLKDNCILAKVYPRIREIPAPFDFLAGEVNAEELAKTKPDVVFGGNARGNNNKLKEMGVPVVQVSLSNPEEIMQAVRVVGKVLGPPSEEKAAQFCDYYTANIRKVTDRTKSLTADQRLKVYYAGNKPISTDGKNSITDAWIEMGGGKNVAASGGVDGVGREVTVENIIQWNPDVIIAASRDAKAVIEKSSQWSQINAVKNNRVYVNPKGVYLWSLRSAEEALQTLWIAKVLQPELFADVDMALEVKNFYRSFYSYELSDNEVSEILNPDK
ncbi:MAG TPA: ABC transporter substrate-binding protein [Methylomusa anaerophila]|uniref:Putative ABC transporter substrate-binding lipoprotein YhfQ n=1 Tax=Methylomusa anaerophila TaxID=1930071 RepID=A0A348AFE4_9FIRM|nr:ABC transporter substrate-binding protein [Methylomusa anaerophila]BBB89792.1 putative ABC transporter substrate-binding lipoprotein YhfQ precursor [Methylomusa anaerophila]HML89162.1 ABC transporter substrate-binding protein [Methylomusa anaerophila]